MSTQETIYELFHAFVSSECPEEVILLEVFDHDLALLAESSRFDLDKKIDDAIGFGETASIISAIAAYVFLLLANKILEDGYNITKKKLLEYMIMHDAKLRKLVKEGRSISNLDEIFVKIYNWLSK